MQRAYCKQRKFCWEGLIFYASAVECFYIKNQLLALTYKAQAAIKFDLKLSRFCCDIGTFIKCASKSTCMMPCCMPYRSIGVWQWSMGAVDATDVLSRGGALFEAAASGSNAAPVFIRVFAANASLSAHCGHCINRFSRHKAAIRVRPPIQPNVQRTTCGRC